MILKINNNYFNYINNTLYFLLLLLPLSFFLGALILNSILIIFFFIFFFLYRDSKKFELIYKSEFKYLFLFCIYLILNTFLNNFNIETFLKSISYLRFPILIIIFLYVFEKISENKKILWANLNILFFLIISIDLLFQYIFGKNIIGFMPAMCGENYLKDKTVCTRYSGFFKDELIMGGYLSTIYLSIILFINSIKKNWFLITIISVLFLYILVMITGERSATLTILLTLFFIFLQYKSTLRLKFFSASFFLVLTFLMIILNPHIKGRFVNFFDYDLKKNNHLSIFEKIVTTPWGLHTQKSLKLFLDKPIIGHGIKSFRYKCDNYELYVDRKEKKHHACSTHPHNLVMELLSEQGIIGFLIFFYFFFTLFRKSIIEDGFFNKDFSLIGLRSLVFVLIFVPKPVGSIFSSVNATMIWFCVSLFLIKVYKKNKNEK